MVKAVNTIKNMTVAGTGVGFFGGVVAVSCAPNRGSYMDMSPFLLPLLMAAGSAAGFTLGVMKALLDKCCENQDFQQGQHLKAQ